MSNYKRLFLEQYQYIFITIVTHNRNPILVENIETLKESIKNTHFKYNFDIVAIAIMPDHLHMIIKVDNINDYPKIIYSMKYYFSKYINVEKISLSESKIKKGEKGVWQRRYWEHTIRNEQDFYRHLDYIHYNPIKHNLVKSSKDYKYTTFEKFVKLGLYEENWCTFENKNKIADLDFE